MAADKSAPWDDGSKTALRIAVPVAGVAGVSLLHYLTGNRESVWHAVFQHLYHVPVIFGAYWFGATGGIATATLAAALYLPHIGGFQADGRQFAFSQYTGVLFLYVIGTTVGLLASAQRRLTARYREAAESLRRSNVELTRSYEEVKRADRLAALGQIAAGLAHEVRNPLGAIKGSLEILRGRAREGSPEAEFSALAEAELTRLETLLTDFLSYARPHEPRLTASPLDDLVDHVVALLRPTAERASVQLEVEHRPGGPLVRIDREQVGQVVFNMVLNAIQASAPGTAVRIRELDMEGELVLEIRDQGPGISGEHAGRIFEPFFTTKKRGTGLGLPIAQRIVAAHGGRIELNSLEGGGTVFRVMLPRATAVAARCT
jgi:signal transduction histidine kinase